MEEAQHARSMLVSIALSCCAFLLNTYHSHSSNNVTVNNFVALEMHLDTTADLELTYFSRCAELAEYCQSQS